LLRWLRLKLPNLVNVHNSKYFSIHDVIIVDAPRFYIFIDDISNAEIYNVIIVEGNSSGLDCIDVAGSNVYVHDVEVTTKENEYVTVKSSTHNFLIENTHCNCSGSCVIGTLAGGTSISNIHYNNIYTQ
jgi:rhamnogalacturonan hydrolase